MADRAKQAQVNTQILDALCRWCPESVAKEIIRAIVRGEVPHLEVRYDG